MKILLVQTAFPGDVVLSTPVIGALKALYPQSELWLLTTKAGAELIGNDPYLSGVIVFDKRNGGVRGMIKTALILRAHNFERTYSLHKSARTALLLFLAGLRNRVGFREAALSFLYHRTVSMYGASSPAESLHAVERHLHILTLDQKESTHGKGELRLTVPPVETRGAAVNKIIESSKRYVVLVPGSVWHTKQWHWEQYHQVAKTLNMQGEHVVVSGSPSEEELCAKVAGDGVAISLAGKASLSDTVALIAHSAAVVCNDSLALHIASTFKIPTVAVFCATSPRFGFGPWANPRACVVEKSELPCKPCAPHGSKQCPIKTEACMRELPAEQVLEALKKIREAV